MEKSKAVLITRYSLMTKSSRERKKDGEEKKRDLSLSYWSSLELVERQSMYFELCMSHFSV